MAAARKDEFDQLDSDQEKLAWITSRYKRDGDYTIMLFDESGDALASRAPWNPPRNPAQQKKYKTKFLANGITAIFRGKFCCQQSLTDPRPDSRIVSAGGTLLGAIYDAIQSHPDNKHCILTKLSGIPNAFDFAAEIPQFAMDSSMYI
jgi:hypothetical protein